MTDIYAVMSMAGSALLTQQRAINVTGNNIANVNTPVIPARSYCWKPKCPCKLHTG